MIENLKRGFVKSFPISIPVAVYGSILGVIALKKGLSPFELILMDVAIFAGTAQFLMLESWEHPLPFIEISLAVLIINMRYLLVGASLKQLFQNRSIITKLGMMHLVADENWAVTISEQTKREIKPSFLLGGGIIVVIMWTGGTLLGYFTGNNFQSLDTQVLSFIVYCVFLSLGVSLYSQKTDLICWLMTAVATYISYKLIPGKWYIIIGGLSGSFTSLLFSTQEDNND